VNPDLLPKLEVIIEKALEKDGKLRYQSATDIKTDLTRLKRDLQSTGARLAVVESRASEERHFAASRAHSGVKTWVILAGMLVAVLAAGFYWIAGRGAGGKRKDGK
jgi:eukaryotic-like serine/threonine-protein kinase